MATSVACTNEACTEYGIVKGSLGGGEIDETIPTYCGTCGTLLLGQEPELDPVVDSLVVDADAGPTWEQVPEGVTYQ